MIAELHYLDEGHLKITAASVGISCSRWTHIHEKDIKDNNYQKMMKQNRFDILPIVSNNNQTYEYFKTDLPNNYQNISRLIINHQDVIPLDTDIRQVIKGFLSEERVFYFLTYQNKINGLITIGNLNCRQVQVYLFAKICDLERTLSDFINDHIGQNQVMQYLQETAKTNDRIKVILDSYQNLVQYDLENNISEHLFLIHFFDIIKNFNFNKALGYSKGPGNNRSYDIRLPNTFASSSFKYR